MVSSAIPRRFAVSTDSSSRIDPPGCTAAVTPAAAATSSESGNGKKASDASTAPLAASPAPPAASRALSTRFGWPAPIPTSTPSRTSVIAFDFTCLQTSHAVRRSASSDALGSRSLTIANAVSSERSDSWTSTPPRVERSSTRGRRGSPASTVRMRRSRDFFLRCSSPSSSYPGATTISKNMRPPVTGLSTSRSAVANAKSIGRLVATMPPYAEIASPAFSARS